MQKGWKISSEDWWGLDYQTIHYLEEVTQKIKSHSKSEVHFLSCQLDVEADRARKEGSIISQLQNVGKQQRLQNRKAIKALIRCTYFLAHSTLHIPLTLTN